MRQATGPELISRRGIDSGITTTGIRPTVDFAFKKIFGSPEYVRSLIGLLNAILELPAPITDVEILNPFNYKGFADDKLVVLAVRRSDHL